MTAIHCRPRIRVLPRSTSRPIRSPSWIRGRGSGRCRQVKSDEQLTPVTAQQPLVPVERAEAGFRICPKCLKPVHLGSEVCRQCGTKVPRP